MFGHRRTGIVTLPEAAVEDRRQLLFERRSQFGRIFARLHRPQGAVVTRHHPFDVLRTAGTPFDFEHAHAGADEAVEEVDRAEVFGRKEVLPLGGELRAVSTSVSVYLRRQIWRQAPRLAEHPVS